MDEQKQKNPSPVSPEKPPRPQARNNSAFWLLIILGAVVAMVYFFSDHVKRSEITYGTFHHELDIKNIAKVEIQGSRVYGEFTAAPKGLEKKFLTTLPPYPLVDENLGRQLRELTRPRTTASPNRPTALSPCFRFICW